MSTSKRILQRSSSIYKITSYTPHIHLTACQSIQARNNGHIARPGEQAVPLTGYYAQLYSNPIATKHPAPSTRPSIPKPAADSTSPPPPPPSKPSATSKSSNSSSASTDDTYLAASDLDRDDVQARARIVFGSRLAGPTARRAEKDRKSNYVAGILVPPRPAEPDNCCMSGCVNCVWDVYREDLEEWAAKASEARAALAKQGVVLGKEEDKRLQSSAAGAMETGKGIQGGAGSVDDDGGGSETNWDLGDGKAGEDLFGGIPVGIREFMKTEKMLKEKHAKEAETGSV